MAVVSTEINGKVSSGIKGHVSNGTNGRSPSKYQGIVASLNSINADLFENDGQRIEAVTAAYALVARLETPWDFVLRTVMGQVRILVTC